MDLGPRLQCDLLFDHFLLVYCVGAWNVSFRQMTTITTSGSEELSKLFFDVVMNVDAVICCRVAPKQKAFVVKVVRQNLPSLITAGIGKFNLVCELSHFRTVKGRPRE